MSWFCLEIAFVFTHLFVEMKFVPLFVVLRFDALPFLFLGSHFWQVVEYDSVDVAEFSAEIYLH